MWHFLVLLGLPPGVGVSDALCALLVGMGSYWIGIGSYGCVLHRYEFKKVGMCVCGNRFCVDDGDNDDDDRDCYRNRNDHAPVGKTVSAPMRFSETHGLLLQTTITNCVCVR